MEAKNLRLGNYVMNGDDIGRVERLSIIRISTSSPHVGVEISPIKLTEEWLLKFGLEKYAILSELQVWWLHDGYRFLYQMGDNYHNGQLGIQVKYVHQLQNLYFALTGKELTITPPNKK